MHLPRSVLLAIRVASDDHCRPEAIVGVGETRFSRGDDPQATDRLSLAVDASRSTRYSNLGFHPTDVDGLITPYMGAGAEDLWINLGLGDLTFAAQVNLGERDPAARSGQLAAAIRVGRAHTVLVPSGWAGYSGRRARSPREGR